MKEYLKRTIEDKKVEIENLKQRSDECEDVKELRAIGETLDKLRREITEAENQLENLENTDGPSDDGDQKPSEQNRENIPKEAELHVIKKRSYGTKETEENSESSIEERVAFMEFACRNKAIPKELRANATTTTSDASAVIPKTIVKRIIQKMESYGNLYAGVTKLDVQGGVEIPILSLKPEAKWITETKTSDDQKLTANESISFSYYGLEVKIAQSLLVNVTSLKMFEDLFVSLSTEAMMKTIEVTMINGTGTGQMLGVTKDTRVPAANVIELTEAEIGKWNTWKKKVFAKMKKSYRTGVFIVNQATFDGYIDGMVDTNGQPIGRVNYGIEGEEKYRFAGKTVETVEDDILPYFDDAESGDVVAVFMKLSDYGINSNMSMNVNHWTDHDTNTIKDQCIMICDGKLIDPNGVLIIKKKVTSAA